MIENFYNFLKQSISIIIIILLLFTLFLYFKQNSMIYVPILNGIRFPEENPKPYQNPSQLNLNYKEIKIKTKDNFILHGWLIYKKENSPIPTILYFHENAGNIGFRLVFIKSLVDELNMNVIIFGYRGYGKSEGTPSDYGLKLDGYSISSWLFSNNSNNNLNNNNNSNNNLNNNNNNSNLNNNNNNNSNFNNNSNNNNSNLNNNNNNNNNDLNDFDINNYVDKNNIFLFGRSLGGAIAIDVAYHCKLPFKGIIIENTFSSLGDLVDHIFPFIKPFKFFLLKNKFETKKYIEKINYPILFCRSENDELIPKKQMERLYTKALNAKFKEYYEIKNGNHNEGYLFDRIGYFEALKDFIYKCMNDEGNENNNKNENNNNNFNKNINENENKKDENKKKFKKEKEE